jgi:hypothetical protein
MNSYRVLVEKPEKKRPLGLFLTKHRWRDNTNTLKKQDSEIHGTHCVNHWNKSLCFEWIYCSSTVGDCEVFYAKYCFLLP